MRPKICDNGRSKNPSWFSELLLEHGERHLQDWAVVASSSVLQKIKPDASSWNQKNKRSNQKQTTTSSSSIRGTNGGSRTHSSKNNADAAVRKNNNNNNNNDIPASCHMHSVEGRLRLCSRSLVFEPLDISRGIIRCPLDRMERPPYAASRKDPASVDQNDSILLEPCHAAKSTTFASDQKTTDLVAAEVIVVVKSTRHLVMKANNAITPIKSETTATEFQFSFLHSTPQKFFELSNVRFEIAHTLYHIYPQIFKS